MLNAGKCGFGTGKDGEDMGHVIAVAGKGGVGKTTLTGLLIQYLLSLIHILRGKENIDRQNAVIG